MIMVAVVHGQFADALASELPRATSAYPGIHFQRLLAVALFQLPRHDDSRYRAQLICSAVPSITPVTGAVTVVHQAADCAAATSEIAGRRETSPTTVA